MSRVRMSKNKNSSLSRELHINRDNGENPQYVGELIYAMLEKIGQGSQEVITLCFDSVKDVQNWTTGYRDLIIKKYVYNDPDKKGLTPLLE